MIDCCDPLAVVAAPVESTKHNRNANGGTSELSVAMAKRRWQSVSLDYRECFRNEWRANVAG